MNTTDKKHPFDSELYDWDTNEYPDTSFTERYTEKEDLDDDYISSDHTDYNRTNSRFFWDDFDA